MSEKQERFNMGNIQVTSCQDETPSKTDNMQEIKSQRLYIPTMDPILTNLYQTHHFASASSLEESHFRALFSNLFSRFIHASAKLSSIHIPFLETCILSRSSEPPIRPLPYLHQEIYSHILAFRYLVHNLVTMERDLSEELIRNTHSILMDKEMGDRGLTTSEYRKKEIPPVADDEKGTGEPRYVKAAAISQEMSALCSEFEENVKSFHKTLYPDVFELSARFGTVFLSIHPFDKANDPMSRVLINAILLKFGGVIVPIGETDGEREGYERILNRAAKQFWRDRDSTVERAFESCHYGLTDWLEGKERSVWDFGQ
jgi:Fic family protein